MLVDSHCHIHDPQFYPEGSEGVYERAIAAGVDMLLVGTSEKDSRIAVDFALSHDKTWAIVGVHPHDSKDGWGEIGEILKQASPKVIGVGEIGLDYYYNNSPRETQIKALERQLQWALDYNLPVSFHVRDAYDDFWPIFDNFKNIRGVLHSFTDSVENMELALNKGLYIGVNGISTFTRSETQQKMFDQVPLEKMLLETDAPFLTPKPFRGTMNEPAYVKLVAEHHAARRGVDVNQISQQTTANAKALFAI